MSLIIHLVDGTYELFRAYYGAPEVLSPEGQEVGAVRGLARSLLSLIRNEGATHVGIAFDHTVESFRNDLFDGYKTGEGMEPELWAQFEPAERVARALGFVVWPMVEFEADDALATAADRYAKNRAVKRVLVCTPDKDLAQCVSGERVVCVDRRRRKIIDEAGVVEKFGVSPQSIPDWLALVGDAADGIPGIPRWGARSAATVLARYGHLEAIPARSGRVGGEGSGGAVAGRQPRAAARRGRALPCSRDLETGRAAGRKSVRSRVERRLSGRAGGLLRRARRRAARGNGSPLAQLIV